jgi:hypothetical protein
LDVQRISQDCAVGEDAFHQINDSVELNGQRANGLREDILVNSPRSSVPHRH